MQTTLIFIYYTIILFVAITAIVKYKQLDKALRSIAILLMLTVLSESLSYIALALEEHVFRNGVYHIFSIIQLILVSMFFIYTIGLKHSKRYIILASAISITMGTLNMFFLQTIARLNSYMLMFESFAIISMTLYYIYLRIKKDMVINMFKQAHFIISLLLLLLWSGSFFFWAFISVLYDEGWAYTTTVTNVHLIINILVYLGIGLTILYTNRQKLNHDNKH